MFQVVIPANFSLLAEALVPIVLFDVLENDKGYDVGMLMKFDEDEGNGAEIMD
jgi:hypothetical protein